MYVCVLLELVLVGYWFCVCVVFFCLIVWFDELIFIGLIVVLLGYKLVFFVDRLVIIILEMLRSFWIFFLGGRLRLFRFNFKFSVGSFVVEYYIIMFIRIVNIFLNNYL